MTWVGWTIVVLFFINSLLMVTVVDKKREPLSPGAAIFGICINTASVIAILAVGTGKLA